MDRVAIKRVERIEDFQDEYVYDIVMRDGSTPFFFANGILVHNSCYFNTFAEDVEEAILVADSVAEVVNESFQEFTSNTFCATTGFDHLVKAAREVVASAGIFVTPKRYILNVADEEGKRVDKPKIMGLDIKKTIIPKDIQQALTQFLVRYLKNEDWDTIAADIVRYKDTLLERDVFDIGLPKGVNGIEKYQHEASVYGPGVTMPGHVRASLFYNSKLGEHGDKQSIPIFSGMKIKVFYLKQPQGPGGKIKSIAIPRDIEMVPQWFYDTIDVDKQKQIDRLVDKPLLNILKAIGKEPPTKKTLLVQEAFSFDD